MEHIDKLLLLGVLKNPCRGAGEFLPQWNGYRIDGDDAFEPIAGAGEGIAILVGCALKRIGHILGVRPP